MSFSSSFSILFSFLVFCQSYTLGPPSASWPCLCHKDCVCTPDPACSIVLWLYFQKLEDYDFTVCRHDNEYDTEIVLFFQLSFVPISILLLAPGVSVLCKIDQTLYILFGFFCVLPDGVVSFLFSMWNDFTVYMRRLVNSGIILTHGFMFCRAESGYLERLHLIIRQTNGLYWTPNTYPNAWFPAFRGRWHKFRCAVAVLTCRCAVTAIP